MEKTLFLFTRKASRTRENFGQHYLGNHAPLGKRLTRSLRGYTVNLVQNRDWPDAVTEIWARTAMDLLTPSISYDSREDFEQVLVDDRSLFDGFRLYVVRAETELVRGTPIESPLGQQTPAHKIIETYPNADALPPPSEGARRIVDNMVSHELIYVSKGTWQEQATDIAVFRMVWSADVPKNVANNCLIVNEYRQIEAPAPGW